MYKPAHTQPKVPHRRYELTLKLGADSWRDLLGILDHIQFELTVKADADEQRVSIVSGGYGSGCTLDVTCDPDVTHDSWYKALQAYLDDLAALKAVEQGGAL